MTEHASFPTSRVWVWVIGFVAAAIAVRLTTAMMFPTIERPDEIFQNLEPAHRLWTGYGIVSWEWRAGIRSWLFPAALSGLMFLTSFFHLKPEIALPFIWATLAVVASGVVAAGVMIGWRCFGVAGAVLCGVVGAFWPDLVYFGPKTLGEVQAGNLLAIAALVTSINPSHKGVRRLFLLGFLLGTAFDLRFQLALSLLLIACWSARLDLRRSWLPLAFGAAIPLLALGLADWWTLGSPFQSIWKNIQINLIQQKADFYGVQPIHYYAARIFARYGVFTVAMCALFCFGFRKAPLLAVTAISVVAFHSVISHKEISFIYPALPCAMIVVGLGAARIVDDFKLWCKIPPSSNMATGLAALISLMTVIIGLHAGPFNQSLLTRTLAGFFEILHAEADLCGLGIIHSDRALWSSTGGYTLLNRPVPIYMLITPQAVTESSSSFNYAVASKFSMTSMSDFQTVLCQNTLCLIHRQGGCENTKLHEISAELINTGQ